MNADTTPELFVELAGLTGLVGEVNASALSLRIAMSGGVDIAAAKHTTILCLLKLRDEAARLAALLRDERIGVAFTDEELSLPAADAAEGPHEADDRDDHQGDIDNGDGLTQHTADCESPAARATTEPGNAS